MAFWEKNTSGMSVLDRSLEPAIEDQDGYLTPVERFFVCNAGTTPRIDHNDYTLQITGNGISTRVTFTYDQLRRMPQRTVPAVMECAGNQRSMFRDVMGVEIDKRPQVLEIMWTRGAMGMAEWRGVSLRYVLEQAGIKKSAYHVCSKGSETGTREGVVQIPIPVAKALDDDTILALEMNGKPLSPDHGFPVRVIVPGWVGTYSVKWVREIEVSTEHLWVTRNTEFYVLMGETWPKEDHAPADGAPITEQSIKSFLALPLLAKLQSGPQILRGYARSPGCPISKVEWSDTEGETWRTAKLFGPNEKYGWVQFHFEWLAENGAHVLMTRATDMNGRKQPATVPFNTGGYLYNAIYPHQVLIE